MGKHQRMLPCKDEEDCGLFPLCNTEATRMKSAVSSISTHHLREDVNERKQLRDALGVEDMLMNF